MNSVVLHSSFGLTYRDYTFSDAAGTLVQGATASTYFSPLASELRAHACKIPVIYKPADYSVEPETFKTSAKRGNPITLLQDGGYAYRFYLTAITGGKKIAPGKYLFYLEGSDFIGLMANIESRGGIYANSTAGKAISDLTGSFALHYTALGLWFFNATPSFYVTDEIYSTRVDGWLPYTKDARSNLAYIMQAANACADLYSGAPFYEPVPRIRRVSGLLPTEIPAHKVYGGDEYTADPIVTEVAVNEYSYLQAGADTKTLYSASGASGELVVFDQPCYDLTASGLTIDESGANYAIVSGTGTLTGRPYTVTKRQLSERIASGMGELKTLDNPLCSSLNSAALLDRMGNYYSTAKSFRSAFVSPDGMSAGDSVQLEDPLGEDVNAFIAEQGLTFSGINKSDTQLITGWSPIMGNIFTQRIVLDSSGTLSVPAGATLMRLILIQGGKGGFGGYKGGDATHGSIGSPADQAGDGGDPGEGGSAGKVTIVDVQQADLAASYTVTVGAAGSPGSIDHGEGTEGGHSSAAAGGTTYTSSNGTVPDYGVADPMTGERYAVNGAVGIYAGKPGTGPNQPQDQEISDAETGVSGVTVWRSGKSRAVPAGAHGGGGPAYGSDGQNAGTTYVGDGADAALDGFNGYTVTAGSFGSGGIGGNGGGGGGATTDAGVSGGSGGHGSAGGPAGQGAVIALFAFGDTPVPTPTVVDLLDADGEQLYDVLFERLRAQEE